MLTLQLLAKGYGTAAVLLKVFTVRVHARVAMMGPWTRLWYFLRGMDIAGRGSLTVDNATGLCELLNTKMSTLYEWLREGRKAGAFRRYNIKGNILVVWMGGLPKVYQQLRQQTGHRGYGAVASVPICNLASLLTLRSTATAIATQELQHKSRFAARRTLNSRERKAYKTPDPGLIVNNGGTSSPKPVRGARVPFLLHVGPKKAFVSRSFIPFGASQESIAEEVGVSDRTVRRHLQEVKRRQVVQTKSAYTEIANAIEWGSPQYVVEPETFCKAEGDGVRLWERNGASSSLRRGYKVSRIRFFKHCGRTWIYRCNLYDLNFQMHSTRFTRKRLEKLINQSGPSRESSNGKLGLDLLINESQEAENGAPKTAFNPQGKEGHIS